MKIVFINPELRPDAKRRILPVGLGYVLTAVKKAGFQFDLIDMDIEHMSMDRLRELFRAQKYDVYAFGCISSGFRFAREIAAIARESDPEGIIIAGNSVASSMPEVLLKNSAVDVAAIGEGDVTIVDILRAIDQKKNFSQVEGIAFREGNEIVFTPRRKAIQSLDDIGFPEWEIFDLKKYDQYSVIMSNISAERPKVTFPLNSARGCPYHCTFCYHVFNKDKYRKYSDPVIMDEIRRLHDRYGCENISFWDELTFPNRQSARNLVEALKGLPFKIGWEAPIRGDLFTKKDVPLLKEMKAIGCDNLAYSLENASPEILKAIDKKLNVKQYVEQTEAIWESGITPLTSIFFGYPQETPETIQMTLDVCEQCRIFPSTGFLLPLPGTPIYEWAKTNGFIMDEAAYMIRVGDRQDFHINLTSMSDQEFIDTVENGLKRLATKLGLDLQSVFKTTTYQKSKAQTDG